MGGGRGVALQLGAGVAAVGLAALTFLGVVDDVLGRIAVAAVVPALVAAAARLHRRPHLALVVGLQLVAFALVAVAVVGAGPDVVVEVLLGGGWQEVLSASPPAPARPGAVLVPVTLAFLASLVTAELVLRTRRVLVVAVPALLLAGVGLAFGEGGAGPAGFTGEWGLAPMVAVTVVLVALVALRGSAFVTDRRAFDERRADRTGPRRAGGGDERALARQRLLVGAPFVAFVVVLAVLLGRILPVTGPEGPVRLRDRLDFPLEDENRLNPLTRLAGDAGRPEVRYKLRLHQPPPHELRIRLAALDRYDGTRWTTGAAYRSAGSLLPGSGDGPPAAEVGYDIEVVEPFDGWLPALDRPARLQAPTDVDVRVDPASGTLQVPGGPLRGLRYGVVSNVATTDRKGIAGAEVATTDEARAAVATHDALPPDLADLRNRITEGASSPFAQLAQLQRFFENDPDVHDGRKFTVNEKAAPGFTVGHVASFLSAARDGRPEMFVAAFATLAWSLGLPTRVVVGFAPAADPPVGRDIELRAGDETAWPEIALAGYGWVPFDVVPGERSDGVQSVAELNLQEEVAQAGEQAGNQEVDQPGANPNLEPVPPPEGGGILSRLVLVAGAAGLAALVLIAVALSPWLRRRRRRSRRRRAPDTAARIEGAWREALDRLVEDGEVHVTACTTRQAAAAVAGHFGDDAARATAELGRLRDAALHDRAEPPPDWADHAWRLSTEIAHHARRRRTLRRRLRAALDRRPLAATALEPDPRDVAPAAPAGRRPASTGAGTAPASGPVTSRSFGAGPGGDGRDLVDAGVNGQGP